MEPTLSGSVGEEHCILSSLEWTDEEAIALNEAIISDGRCLLPAGVNKHFNMIAINRKFQLARRKKVESRVLWERLNEFFDISKVDSLMTCPFPNEQTEFSLPENDFSELIRSRRSQGQDKLLDDESRDYGSGQETPPNLPLAKRGAAVQSSLASSSNKRKYSSSFSESEGSSSTGRKSGAGTPSGSGSSKTKRRI